MRPGNVVMRDRILMDFPSQMVKVWTMRLDQPGASR
jgi:hypothetical protein